MSWFSLFVAFPLLCTFLLLSSFTDTSWTRHAVFLPQHDEPFFISFLLIQIAIISSLFICLTELVRALGLVNLAGRTLLHGPLKFKVFCLLTVAWFSQIFLTYIASKSLKLSFILNCILKCANDLKTKLIRFAFDLLQKF